METKLWLGYVFSFLFTFLINFGKAKWSPDKCSELGFSSHLLCGSCEYLKEFGLSTLEESCFSLFLITLYILCQLSIFYQLTKISNSKLFLFFPSKIQSSIQIQTSVLVGSQTLKKGLKIHLCKNHYPLITLLFYYKIFLNFPKISKFYLY